MPELPLHPALVHLPLGLAFLLPLLGLAVLFAVSRNLLPREAWVGVVLVAALAFGVSMTARETGETEEHRLAGSLPKAAVEAHEEAAGTFITSLGAFTLLSAAAMLLRKPIPFRLAMAVLSLSAFGVMTLGFRAGRLGGELVFVHHACQPR